MIVAINEIHRNPGAFDDPDGFDPQRYLTASPSAFEWLPYGGGTRRCPGSTFANVEMDLVLRTVLQRLAIEPTTAPGEKFHSGVWPSHPRTAAGSPCAAATDAA